MPKKLIITASTLSAAVIAGYAVYKTLFKEPGHPATWGPTQAINYAKEHGHLPAGVTKKVRRQISSSVHALTKTGPVVLPAVEEHLKKGTEAVTEIMETIKPDEILVPIETKGTSEGEEKVKTEPEPKYDTIPDGITVHHVHAKDQDAQDGSIKGFSPAYRTLIQKALKEAEKDEGYRLYLSGGVHGLGSRGSSILKTGPSDFVHVYDLRNINKLADKLKASPQKD